MAGALSGVRVLEIGGLGPAPFCSMMLADHGADVLRIERPDKVNLTGAAVSDEFVAFDVMSRNRPSAAIDLRTDDGSALVGELAANADVFIEGFRPGVAERLGIGPDELCSSNPRLVYGRMTGWGRSGPLAERAGHDINYISLAGAQAHIGRAGQPPTPPLNLVGDFGGGGLLLAFGICAALVQRGQSGLGQVVDAAMVDGAALLMAPLFGAMGSGYWNEEAGTNLLDSGAPFYDCYRCSDGKWLSIGAIEQRFYDQLIDTLGLSDDPLPEQMDQQRWPDLKTIIAARVGSRTRDEWVELFEGVDACVAPVLSMTEAPDDAHLSEWGTFTEVGGVVQPAPAPRMSRTPPGVRTPPVVPGANTDAALESWGVSVQRIAELRSARVIA